KVERFETHGNLVFLAGADAYKIKRAVSLPYMDFSTLEKREQACAREVEVNRRLAADLYLGAIAIARTASGSLTLGGSGEVVEWAVHMRRFDQSALLSNLAAAQAIGPDLARAVADAVLESHRSATPAAARAGGARQMGSLARSLSEAFARLKAFDGGKAGRFARGGEGQLRRARTGVIQRHHTSTLRHRDRAST